MNALPNIRQLAQMLIEAEDARERAEAERDEAIRTKAKIGSRREASAMGTASAARRAAARVSALLGASAEQATVDAVAFSTGTRYNPAPLQEWCEANLITPAPCYGALAWPADAWLVCYGLDLTVVFPIGVPL